MRTQDPAQSRLRFPSAAATLGRCWVIKGGENGKEDENSICHI